MKTKSIVLFLSIITFCNLKGQETNELLVYNSLFDTLLFDFTVCLDCRIYKPKNLENDSLNTLYNLKTKLYFTNSNEFRNELLNLDSSIVCIFVNDTLKTLYSYDFKNYKKYLNGKLKHDPINRKLIRNLNDSPKTCLLNYNKLKHKRFTFLSSTLDPKDNLSDNIGFEGNILYVGLISLSRVYFSSDYTNGMFYFQFRGSNDCGYGKFLFVRYINMKWEIYKEVKIWES